KKRAVCVVSPHAGLVYSGPVAGAVFSSVSIPETCVLLGPSHRYSPVPFAVMREGEWETPLGPVSIHTEIADRLLEDNLLTKQDVTCHSQEHSLEVQLPFLQYFQPALRFIPVCVSSETRFDELELFGASLARCLKQSSEEVLIVASTDMSHYISREEARKKDFLAIRRILDLDAGGLYETVQENRISMCGFQPTVAALVASIALGASVAELIRYQSSGDVSGDYDKVVGYAGIRII
ncbi:MAG: AmmeMemoRadiSam system protein B, partial [Candidatus Aminicenantes bacterium]|nr:AmmeMemoRadiSam system protein B [Candidatus Aminicenantes bacterium]